MLRHLLLLALAVAASAADPSEIIFCSYNVQNYNDGQLPLEGSTYGTKPKSEESIAVLVRIISEIKPDILGLCEMGPPAKLADLQRRLKEAGLDLPHAEHVQAQDTERNLALLSRFPIVARNPQTDVRYELNGVEERVKRGFLDATIEVNSSYQLRCVGVHLKSKLPVPAGEALIRRMEASKLRAHLDAILAGDPETNLICYGDFNDTKNEPMFQEVSGVKGSPGFMSDLWCRDPLGDRWTHYWKTADEYARIDYLFVSQALFPEVNKSKSSIYRSNDWNTASDHRPIYTSIRPVNVTRGRR
jgi:endonuclease/exonuclease/phosphatase family metal-dependent hydrolase